jgi:hypothetical protein
MHFTHGIQLVSDSYVYDQEYIDKQSGLPWDHWKPEVGLKKLGRSM